MDGVAAGQMVFSAAGVLSGILIALLGALFTIHALYAVPTPERPMGLPIATTAKRLARTVVALLGVNAAILLLSVAAMQFGIAGLWLAWVFAGEMAAIVILAVLATRKVMP